MNLESPTRSIRWPVVRVVPNHDVCCMLLSGDWFRLSTHFHRRTLLCTDNDLCPLCSLLPSRPYWYLPCLVLPNKCRGLLELSATTSADLEQRAKMLHGRIGAGLSVRLTRRGKKRPVYAEIVDDVACSPSLVLATWVSAVMAIFGFSAMREYESLESYSARIQPAVLERAEALAAHLRGDTKTGAKSRS